ncbi:MAG: hypothetical protein Q8P27_02970, partial [Candidatus Peregrinibacteria bacterium]|nr:hypothetical protein [Candidatus Peregrinibacteria bacterium]
SYICEVLVDVQTVTKWSTEAIEELQELNVDAITRYNDNLTSSAVTDETTGETSYTLYSFDQLGESYGITRTNEDQNVYKITDADLHMDLQNGQVTVVLEDGTTLTLTSGKNYVPTGAHTFIVENGTLYVDSNIEYDPTFDMENVTDLSDIPSIAFIVLGGDVYISNTVTDMVGVYYVEEVEGVGGNLDGDWTDPFTPLEIFGSVYGNIEPLLEQRTFSGPASYDHGNVVIRYDARVELNTPSGLEEFVNIVLQEVVR